LNILVTGGAGFIESNVVEANILSASKETHTPLIMNCATQGWVTADELVINITNY